MAIQFNCPSCDAMIRVPDASAGKRGTCPRCSEKLIVPVIPTGEATGRTDRVESNTVGSPDIATRKSVQVLQLPGLGESEPAGFPALGNPPGLSPFQPSSNDGSSIGAAQENSGLPGLPAFSPAPLIKADPATTSPAIGLPALGNEGGTASEFSRKVRSRKKSSAGAVFVPLACAAAMIGVLLFFYWNSTPKLEGQLAAQSVKNLEVRPGFIPGNLSGLSKDDLGGVLRHLKAQSVHWSSSASRTTLKGSDDGVEVTVQNGTASHFVAVNPGQSKAFVEYIKANGDRLDADRKATIASNAPRLFSAWKEQFDKNALFGDQKTHRDLVAWPSLVSGIGFYLEAVVRETAYACVYQDADGVLYFLLPNATRSFVIQGRSVPSGVKVPVKFQVKIVGTTDSSSSRKKSNRSKTKEELEAENLGMNPELYQDKGSDGEKMNPASEGDAIGNGLDSLLTGRKSNTSPKSRSPKKSEMMMEDDEMMEASPNPKSSKSKSMPKDGQMEKMDEENMEGKMSEEMPAKRPTTSKSSIKSTNQ